MQDNCKVHLALNTFHKSGHKISHILFSQPSFINMNFDNSIRAWPVSDRRPGLKHKARLVDQFFVQEQISKVNFFLINKGKLHRAIWQNITKVVQLIPLILQFQQCNTSCSQDKSGQRPQSILGPRHYLSLEPKNHWNQLKHPIIITYTTCLFIHYNINLLKIQCKFRSISNKHVLTFSHKSLLAVCYGA